MKLIIEICDGICWVKKVNDDGYTLSSTMIEYDTLKELLSGIGDELAYEFLQNNREEIL